MNCFGYDKDGWDYYGLASGWSFECRATSLRECQKTENEFPTLRRKIVSFIPGKKCEEVNCEQHCGCDFLGDSISVGTKFPLGCGTCECTLSHRIVCPCITTNIRKEIRDLSFEELFRYQNAIKTLVMQNSPSGWTTLAELYRNFLPQSHGNNFFLPWHRFFIRYAEMRLQEVDCSVTIPYFDWTLDVGNLENSIVWQSNMFGNNGEQSNNFCVRNHPFKNNHPPHWKTGCLRRNFNSSIHLPNAIEIEKLSRLQFFEEFSSELDKITGLFHLFVGGHMASPNSMYDPILLSFYAYIDKIWYDWTVNNPNNVEKFPQELRHLPMAPFGVTPDDVLLSMTQLCVSYIQVTDGIACIYKKATNVPQERSSMSKQIFDIDGYDFEGYDKYGFDRSGWNRIGFNRDSFNRDGFDSSGFDRNGFNRYGLDRHGCNVQGSCFFDTDFESNRRKINIPWEDFNELGFRPTGLNFQGYDIFGFDINGFDKENCSQFFKGPFYPVHMKNIKIKLKDMKIEDLNKIQRICPDITSVPIAWLNLYWIIRYSNANKDISVKSTVVENVFSPFSSLSNTWLVPVPDER